MSATKMEAALFDRAKILALDRLVAGADFAALIGEIEASQQRLAAEHKNWKRVEIRTSVGVDGMVWLFIGGTSALYFKTVKGNF
jgi:hypothetical protein